MTATYIYLHDVSFHAFHGVLPQERAVGADFVVNLRVGYDVTKAMETDDVADTLNYAQLYELVRRENGIYAEMFAAQAQYYIDAAS